MLGASFRATAKGNTHQTRAGLLYVAAYTPARAAAAEWFINTVLPLLRQSLPGAYPC